MKIIVMKQEIQMKIEKGVPIPVTNPKKHTKYGYLREMDYGDSVVTDSNTKKQIISAS